MGDKIEKSEIGCTHGNQTFIQILNRKLNAELTRETWVWTDNTNMYFIKKKGGQKGVDRIQLSHNSVDGTRVSFEVSQWHS
jgi:hypothetical protein